MNDQVFRLKRLPAKLLESRLQFIEKRPVSHKMRPLCLGQKLLTLISRMFVGRIEPIVDADPVFWNRFGFRSDMSVEEFYGVMLDRINEWLNEGYDVSMTACDIQGAFTSVPLKKLILAYYEMIKRSKFTEKPFYIVAFVHMWTKNRVVYFEKTCFQLKSGVPMGDPLSPISFLIYLDWNSDSADSMMFYFADDGTIVSRGRGMEKLGEEVKKSFKSFVGYLGTRDLKCEDSKSKFMLLNRTKATAVKHFKSIMDELKIKMVNEMKILGVMCDWQ